MGTVEAIAQFMLQHNHSTMFLRLRQILAESVLVSNYLCLSPPLGGETRVVECCAIVLLCYRPAG